MWKGYNKTAIMTLSSWRLNSNEEEKQNEVNRCVSKIMRTPVNDSQGVISELVASELPGNLLKM